MPKVEQQIGVTVKGEKRGDRRKFSIEIEAPEAIFQVSDLLYAHGAYRSLDSVLRDRTREIVAEHVKSTKIFLKKAAREGREEKEEKRG